MQHRQLLDVARSSLFVAPRQYAREPDGRVHMDKGEDRHRFDSAPCSFSPRLVVRLSVTYRHT